jgi:hypothetical protein
MRYKFADNMYCVSRHLGAIEFIGETDLSSFSLYTTDI